jgi:hypothetical protein
MMSDKGTSRGRWILAAMAGAALAAGAAARLRARQGSGQADAPPARLAYRLVLRPRYDAQHRWQIPSPTAAGRDS